MIRAVIDDVVGTYSPRITSYKSAWARMQRCLVQDYFDSTDQGGETRLGGGIDDAQTWLISHAMDFKDSYNLFGGWSSDTHHQVRRVVDYFGPIYSLERQMPDLEALLRVRAEKTKSDLLAAEWETITARRREIRTITHQELLAWAGHATPDVVLGDSHALTCYQQGALVVRHDGLTLHGLLERGLYETLRQSVSWNFKKLTVCAGNIDIRHHLSRPGAKPISELVWTLHADLVHLIDTGVIEEYEVVGPMPIEHEERRLPQTGYYKNTPFYGSRQDRMSNAYLLGHEMSEAFGDAFWHWPQQWFALDGEEFAKLYMEKPQSVHLSPAWHRWDYVNNCPNEALAKEYS